ncbi:MAG: hypothetical protein ACI9J3_000364 [Parvicellaceae bacterium]
MPVKKWLEEFGRTSHPKINLSIDLHYFNTSTSRILLNLFRVALGLQEEGKIVEVIWIYDFDDDIKEAGEDYQTILRDFIYATSTKSELKTYFLSLQTKISLGVFPLKPP